MGVRGPALSLSLSPLFHPSSSLPPPRPCVSFVRLMWRWRRGVRWWGWKGKTRAVWFQRKVEKSGNNWKVMEVFGGPVPWCARLMILPPPVPPRRPLRTCAFTHRRRRSSSSKSICSDEVLHSNFTSVLFLLSESRPLVPLPRRDPCLSGGALPGIPSRVHWQSSSGSLLTVATPPLRLLITQGHNHRPLWSNSQFAPSPALSGAAWTRAGGESATADVKIGGKKFNRSERTLAWKGVYFKVGG